MKIAKIAAYGIAAVALTLTAGTAQAADGEKVFNKCKGCHTADKNRVGPMLGGVVGRAAGAVDGFKYSDAMASSGLTWDEATLAKYLADPKGMVPGTKMAFPGLKKDDEIAAVIEYMKGL